MLRQLAESFGITTSHVDGLGRDIQASDPAMLTVLRALGLDIDSANDAESIRRDRGRERPRLAPPCAAGVSNKDLTITLTGECGAPYKTCLHLESGETRFFEGTLSESGHGADVGAWSLPLGVLDSGYHRLESECGSERVSTHLLIAPAQRFGVLENSRRLGLFAPLYALRGERDWGVGSYSDLGQLMAWAAEQGVDFLGTLPLSAGNYREDFQTSPYSPVSRLFWNEIYLDVDSLASRFPSQELSELASHPRFESERERLAALPLIDYQKTSESKARMLSRMAQTAWQEIPQALEAQLRKNPELHTYAAFRATMEASGKTYHHWPEAVRGGDIESASYEQDDYRYHVFVQWAAEEQLAALGGSHCELYLDLSVGAGGASYDVWRHQQSFVSGVDVGAPPDGLFAGGQNWALPPLHPERSREGGHDYFAQCVRANMRHAGMLRVDHVMGLHRLYWVPSDLGASEGLYVRYPAEELYAILRIEAARNQCALAGEDLGTVPESVRPAMEEAGMRRLYVGQFSVQEGHHQGWPALQPAPETSIASLNTHDTPTFAGWLANTDLDCDAESLMKAWTEALAEGPAAALVVTLEDLWLEVLPQNQPGTGEEEPNWRRRFQKSLSEIIGGDEPGAWLRHLRSLRAKH